MKGCIGIVHAQIILSQRAAQPKSPRKRRTRRRPHVISPDNPLNLFRPKRVAENA